MAPGNVLVPTPPLTRTYRQKLRYPRRVSCYDSCMTPVAARKILGRYVGLMAARLASHFYVRPNSRPAICVQGDTLVTPFDPISPAALAVLADSLMPRACEKLLTEMGEARFTVRAVELKRHYLFVVRRRHGNVEIEIRDHGIGDHGKPPDSSGIPFDPKRKPPTLRAEAIPEEG